MHLSDKPLCQFRYCHRAPASWVLAGFALLEQEGALKIGKVERFSTFLPADLYPHNNIVEVWVDGHLIVFDYENGTQSLLRMAHFDEQLEKVHAYFETNLFPDFGENLTHRDRIHPFISGTFTATCPGNPYDRIHLRNYACGKSGAFSLLYDCKHRKEYLRSYDYRNMMSEKHFPSYRLLFWARMFGDDTVNTQDILKTYPFLSESEAKRVAQAQTDMLQGCNRSRIEICSALKKEYGSLLIGGIADCAYARRVCPDLITHDEAVSTREKYHETMHTGVIGVATYGHYMCVEAKFGELLASGRAILSEPVHCIMPGDFAPERNYAAYTNTDELCEQIESLLHDPDRVHEMESVNAQYFRQYMAPRECVLQALQTAFPDHEWVRS